MNSFTVGLAIALCLIALICLLLGWSSKTRDDSPFIRETENRKYTCDTCAFQKGRNYCEYHELTMRNMSTLTCNSWSPKEVSEDEK